MNGIILAAGRGSRMGFLTDHEPKCMQKFNNKTLLERQKESMIKAGIDSIIIVTGYLSKKVNLDNVKQVLFNLEWQNTNMFFSLLCAKNILETQESIVSYSDIFYDSSLVEALMKINQDDCDMVITYDPEPLKLWSKRMDDPIKDLETFKKDKDNFLLEIGNKPNNLSEIEGQYMGLLKFFPSSFSKILDKLNELDIDTKKLDMTSFLSILLKNNFRIKCVPNYSPWGEVDTMSDLTLYEKLYPNI